MRELPVTAPARRAFAALGALACAALAATAAAGARGGARGGDGLALAVRATLAPEHEVAGFELADLDGAPGAELLLVGAAGELVAYGAPKEGAPARLAELGRTRLEDPARLVLDLAPRSSGGPSDVLVAGPGGVARISLGAAGFAEPEVLAARARFTLRTGRPTLADIAQDVNGDGRFDVVLPGPSACELWLATGEAGAPLRRAAVVAADVEQASGREAERLSDRLSSSLVVPRLVTRDVNGDLKDDLCVVEGSRRAFHLQGTDGAFPAQADVAVDLAIFRDTTPAAELAPGGVLALADETHYESRDLDRDGIPDYVLAHRRKVWVFHGSAAGPQFERPSNVLKAAEDVTALVLAELDGDGYPDLMLFKVQVPGVAALIRAFFAEWEVPIDAIGYQNRDGRAFDTRPAWRGSIAVRLPSILSVMRDPDRLLERFREVGRAFRAAAEADVDGDGASDVALVAEDRSALEVWRGAAGAEPVEGIEADAILRRVFFEDEDRTWDLDRVVSWITSLAARRVERMTAGRVPDGRFLLRDAGAFDLADLEAADLDGDGRAELVLRYVPRGAPLSSVFDVLGTQ